MRSNQLTLAPIALAAALLSLSGCQFGLTCNAMYAPDQLTIELDGAYADGDYELEIVGGSVDALCTFVVGDGTAESTWCEGPGGEIMFETGSEGELVWLSLWEHTPDQVRITLFLDGAELASEQLEPDYTEDEPNGKGCGERSFGDVVFAW